MDNLESVDLHRLTYRQLQKMCKHNGLPTTGKTAVLRERLMTFIRKSAASRMQHSQADATPHEGEQQEKSSIRPMAGTMDEEDEDDGVSRVDNSKPEIVTAHADTSKPEPQQPSRMDNSRPQGPHTRMDDSKPQDEPQGNVARVETSPAEKTPSRVDMSLPQKTASRVEISGPKVPIEMVHSTRKREREVDSIEPIVAGGAMSITKSQGECTRTEPPPFKLSRARKKGGHATRFGEICSQFRFTPQPSTGRSKAKE